MNLRTTYMGLELGNPLVVGPSPLCDDLDTVKALAGAGAGALVLRSLFMEQILQEQLAADALEANYNSFAEALDYFPAAGDFGIGPQAYLDHIKACKAAVSIPILASLNGTSAGEWVDYARSLAEAGADGLELNIYHLPVADDETPEHVEQRYVDILTRVKAQIGIPVAVKLTSHHTSPVNFAKRLAAAGADGLVLFNRLYLPTFDEEELEVHPTHHLSDSTILPLRLLWLAAMHGKVDTSLSATGGVHTAKDALRAIMAGASTVQLVSALLRRGPDHLARVKAELEGWLIAHEYASLDQARGSMSLAKAADPEAFERANYMKSLQTYSA